MRQATPGYERTAAPREYSASSAPEPSVAIVAAICGAEILGLAGFSIVAALLPQFIGAWSLTNTQAGWLAGIASAGYMLAVIPLVSLTDRRSARQIYRALITLSALSCFGMAVKRHAIGTPDRHRKRTPRRRWDRLVPVANRRAPRAPRSALTSDGAAARGRGRFAHRGKPGWHSGAVF